MIFLKKYIVAAIFFITSPVSANTIFELVVPFPPGGSTDIVGRYVAKILNDANIPTVVQNRAGAQGTIGVKSVAKTSNIQNTLLLLGTGPGLYAPLMMDPAPYNVQDDFEIITTVASDSIVVIVPATSKIKTAKQLVQAIKTAQAPLRYGHGAMNQKFAGLVFLNTIQGHAIEVPFNGAAPTVFAVASDSLEFGFVNYTDTKEFAKSGRVRIIGIASKQRRNDVLNVKTFAEQGIEFDQQAWFTLAAPKGMDKNTIMRLNAVVTDALKNDKISYVATEMIPMHSSVAGAKIFIDTQYKTYRPLIEKVKALSANN